jgi:hypothetical protein
MEFIKVRGKKVTWFKDLSYCPHSHSQIKEREYALNIVRENDYPKRFLNDSLNDSHIRTTITPMVIPLSRVRQQVHTFMVSQDKSRES